MRKLIFSGLIALFLCASCSTKQPDRILFVGNSLTYVGNLPAVFSALARANGHAAHSYMLVSPGGTLSDRVADESVVPALRDCGCATLVLQERGGDLLGNFGDDALAKSKRAIATLAEIQHTNGTNVILLGTYNSPRLSHQLVTMEGAAARADGIPYIAVAEQFWRLHDAYPSRNWLYKDGMHPGRSLTLLNAILVYKQLYGTYPVVRAFVVDAPIYGTASGLKPTLRVANAPSPDAGTLRTVSYSADEIDEILLFLNSPVNN